MRGRGVLDGRRRAAAISLQSLNALLKGVTLTGSPQYNLAA